MAIDPYSPCPCGSGKKLKFCCSDLVHEIEKIEKLIEGEQPHAALRYVEQLLKKQPERASLLDLRVTLELSLEDYDAARETVQRYLSLHPENPSAYGQAARMAAAKGETAAAVGALQAALERLNESDLPQRVFEAIGAVGQALLLAGDLVAGRGHLLLYAAIAPEDDNFALELLLRMHLEGRPPMLLRDTLYIQTPPEEAPWRDALEQANRLARNGLWQRAEAEYVQLAEQTGPEPAVVYNLALVRGWLGDAPQFAAGMHQYARLDVPWDDAVEAEALAQLVDPPADAETFDVEHRTYELPNEDLAEERMLADRRTEQFPWNAPEEADRAAQPMPRASFLLLDRPAAATGVGIRLDEVPNVIAFVSIYGRRTDRPAHLTMTVDQSAGLDQVEETLRELLGDALGQRTAAEVVESKPLSEQALSWRWRLPDDTPEATRRELLTARRRQAVLQDWPEAPQAVLGGLSAREAADKQELKLPLAASVLIVEQAAADLEEAEMFRQLREQLALPPTEPIDPSQLDAHRLPLVRIPRIQLDRATNEQLMTLQDHATLAGAQLATLAVASEIVSRGPAAGDEAGGRPDGDAPDGESPAELNFALAYRHLIRVEPNPDRALQWVRSAQQWAEQAGEPTAEWAVMFLELQLERRDPYGVTQALDELRERHAHEPAVIEAVYRLLYAHGLADPGESADRPTPSSAAPAPAAGIWTPESDRASDAPADRPAIWTP